MKTAFLTLLGAAAIAASPASAGTPPPPAPVTTPAPASDAGFFVGVKGGFFWLQDESAQQGGISADVNFKTGWGVTLPIGYDFGNGFSVAFTAGYYEAGIDSIDITSGSSRGSVSANGEVQLVPLMANASYHVKLVDNLHWYVGAGLGTVHNEVSVDSVGGQNIGYDQSGWDFGFQAFTGLRYELTEQTSLNLGYRFLHVNSDGDDHNGHSLEIGVSWRF